MHSLFLYLVFKCSRDAEALNELIRYFEGRGSVVMGDWRCTARCRRSSGSLTRTHKGRTPALAFFVSVAQTNDNGAFRALSVQSCFLRQTAVALSEEGTMNVAVFSTKSYDREFLERLNTPARHQLTFFEASLNPTTTNLTLGFEAVCVFVNDSLDQSVIETIAANGIRAIVLRCAGFNNVDLRVARAKNLRVFRVPAYSPQAVAEHAVALILTLNRKTHKAYNRIRENNFSLEKLLGFNLYGKTVGVIGTGQIGSVFCRIMLGFGCRVVATDVVESEDLKRVGVAYLPLEQLLPAADIISLHCPLTPDTHHLMDHTRFALMKKGAMLINTSRGAVIDTQAAVEALKSGQLGQLGIDVYEQEEHLFFRDLSESIVLDDLIARLMTFPNVLITAHQGFFTREALEQIATTTLKNLSDFEQGRRSANEVTLGEVS